ncbi:MAG: class I SAM-dependent DNA methyltransferase [Polaromonas sp.]|uniref:class I SAM-dependent DNA methyltransferase n=1 Tax=Polaromonas sp. TaxID=1869339 RepID=UPI00403714C5
MTPQEFIAKWGPGGPAYYLNEEQGAQSHFLDLCQMLGVPKPGSEAGYVFEKQTLVLGEARGYADVFKSGVFAWENKAPGRNLDAALRQLLTYSLALSNPPILVVCDRLTIRIHTQFTGHPTETFNVLLAELDQPDKLALLRRIWANPESFRPKKTSRDITEAAAKSFATLADGLRKRGPDKAHQPLEAQTHADEVAHFLTQCLFCFFAEDVGLLPGRMFEGLVNNHQLTSDKLTAGLRNLFTVMRDGGLYGNDDIPWFNGGLFKKIKVPALTVLDMTELRNAAALNWSAIDVSIFGTLFERGLDPSKRSQLGAHYTDPATIMRIVEPVLKRPLLQIWEQTAQEMRGLMAKNKKKNDASYKAARVRFIQWLNRLKDYRVLDPACGSGNFLFLGLKTLKDIEHQSHIDAALMGMDREADLVTGPHNMLGIELNEYAAELARVTVWIGELQWRLLHGYEFKTDPVLEPLDHIECRDALLSFDAEGQAYEAAWPKASVVIGNPPFLGDKKMRAELGGEYTETLRAVYKGRVPGGADLVCYWFEKSRKAIEANGLGAAGLVATNSIRGGKNRAVLDAISQTTRIYEAWSDEGWVNEGAAVRVSLVAFGHATQKVRLDGDVVDRILADLRANNEVGNTDDLVSAKALRENEGIALQGPTKGGSFDVDGALATQWIRAGGNPNRKSNADVLKPWFNGDSVTGRWSGKWIIDFAELSEEEARLYESPFEHVVRFVKPARLLQNMESRKVFWWRYNASAPKVRNAISKAARYLVTPEVAKHRVFAWLPLGTAPDKNLVIFLRQDDCFFGVLQSRFHEVWALHKGTSLEDRPRYTSSTTFRTFPFPAGLTPADTAHQTTEVIEGGALIPAGLSVPNMPSAQKTRAQAATNTVAVRAAAESIARAAKRLNDLREAWLNPPEWTQRVPEVIPLGMAVSPYPDRILPKDGFEKELAQRTLTKLYNLRPAWLVAAHGELDLAVAAAYGWADYSVDMPDEEILKRLLALNLQRSK